MSVGNRGQLQKVIITPKENATLFGVLDPSGGSTPGTSPPSSTITFNSNNSYGGGTASVGGIKVDATVVNGTSTITLSTATLDGVAITDADFGAATLKIYDASDEENKTIILDKYTWDSGTKVLDVTNATGAFTFATADDVLLLMGTESAAGYDTSTSTMLVTNQNPDSDKYTDMETLVTTSDIGAVDDTYVTQGSLIDVRGYDVIGIGVAYVDNNSTGGQLQVRSYQENGGTAFRLENASEYQKTLIADDNVLYIYETKTVHFIDIQTKATVVGATEGTVTITLTKDL